MENPIPLDQLFEGGAEVRDGHCKTTTIIRSSLAIVSIIASFLLIMTIRRSNSGLSTTYHRLLLGMSIADIVMSVGLATFNSMIPSDDDYYVWNAKGNLATCNAQGFVLFMGASVGLLYSCSLNLYCLVVVKYQKTDFYIRKKVEPFLHGVPILFSTITAITLVARNNINSDGYGMCFVPVYDPPHCEGVEDGKVREGFTIPCGRGNNGGVVYAYFGFFFVLFAVPIIIGISLGMIYRSVLQQEKKLTRYGAGTLSPSAEQSSNTDDRESGTSLAGRLNRVRGAVEQALSTQSQQERKKSRTILYRALSYSLAYLLTWGFVIVRISVIIAGEEWPTTIWYLASIFNPLQGLYNLLIYYLQPKVLKANRSREDNRDRCRCIFAKAFSRSKTADAEDTGKSDDNDMPQNIMPPKSSACEEENSIEEGKVGHCEQEI